MRANENRASVLWLSSFLPWKNSELHTNFQSHLVLTALALFFQIIFKKQLSDTSRLKIFSTSLHQSEPKETGNVWAWGLENNMAIIETQ